MPVYTVHAPLAGDRPQLERVVLVRDGFHLSAAVFGPLWFLAQRLWFGLLAYLAIVAALAAALALLHVDLEAQLFVALLVALLTGFEGASVQRWSCSRGRWRLLDVVVANNRGAAEHRFFERWNETHAGGFVPPVDRGAPPPVRPSSGGPAGFGEVMGLFPQPRAPR
ncbi:MAG: DUF2628 domain-containing protein [Xanthobacteraceae bacterium]|nr:DUF2628 domain-containing protein [Xanthobacteraceae bacterium]